MKEILPVSDAMVFTARIDDILYPNNAKKSRLLKCFHNVIRQFKATALLAVSVISALPADAVVYRREFGKSMPQMTAPANDTAAHMTGNRFIFLQFHRSCVMLQEMVTRKEL